MSILGFDAIGRLSLGQIRQQPSLAASSGSFALTGVSGSFKISEAANAGSFALTGNPAPIGLSLAVVAGSYSVTGFAVSFKVSESIAAGSFAVTGGAANDTILVPEPAGSFQITAYPAQLSRTGFDYEFQQGGIGHLLMEMQRAKQLAAITRTIPPPVDRRTAPTFRPVATPQAAPIAPAVDVAAIQKQRMEAASAAAKVAKKRREEEAILLLAS